jgi:Mce-associated membrane protein
MALAVLTAVIVAASGFVVWTWLAERSSLAGNTAVADTAATARLTGDVGAAVKEVFSYDYDNLDRTRRAAATVLVDAARPQYQAVFDAAARQAATEKLIRTTTIASIGARELDGDTARLLVFLDQQTLNTTTGQQSSTSAALDVSARNIDGTWKIAAMNPL